MKTSRPPQPGDMCRVIIALEALRTAVCSSGTEYFTSAIIIPEGEVFLVLSSNELVEVPLWEFDIMYKSCTYYVNVPVAHSMIQNEDGEGGYYDFPFEAVRESDNGECRGGDTCMNFGVKDKKAPPLSLLAAPKSY